MKDCVLSGLSDIKGLGNSGATSGTINFNGTSIFIDDREVIQYLLIITFLALLPQDEQRAGPDQTGLDAIYRFVMKRICRVSSLQLPKQNKNKHIMALLTVKFPT